MKGKIKMTEKYYIEFDLNDEVIIGTMLFNSEEEAIKWWDMVGDWNKSIEVELWKEVRKENSTKADIEFVRELK